VEHAVGARVADADWRHRLTAALAEFPDCDWAVGQLVLPGAALSADVPRDGNAAQPHRADHPRSAEPESTRRAQPAPSEQ